MAGADSALGSLATNLGAAFKGADVGVFFLEKSGNSDNIVLIVDLNLSYLFVCEANLPFAVLIFGKM